MPIHGMPTSLPSLPYRWGRGVARRGLCLSGMQRKQAAAELGAGAGAVHHWTGLYRAGGMAAPETGTEGRHAAGRNR